MKSFRRETGSGWSIESRHDGYVRVFGIEHARKVLLSRNGDRLAGRDALTPKPGTKPPQRGFAIRFHLHPDVRCSPIQGGDVLIKLPNGEGWRFQAPGAAIAIEDSVYLGGDVLRRCEQLVLSGSVHNKHVEVGWVFERIPA